MYYVKEEGYGGYCIGRLEFFGRTVRGDFRGRIVRLWCGE